MNYLAHLFLGGETAESMIGNLAGDFVKGRIEPGPYAEGILKHRRIDAFTDTHPSVAAFRRVLIPEHRHYARVISDVFLDHFLASDFTTYSSEALEAFLDRTFALMDPLDKPGGLARVYPRLKGWMLSYRDIDNIHIALTNMSKRLTRTPHLESATHHLIDSRAELERRFREFFPDVVAFASR